MSGAQDRSVHMLARKAGEDVPDEMTRVEVSVKIEELRGKTFAAGPAKPRRKDSK